jgi:hypothetical protein
MPIPKTPAPIDEDNEAAPRQVLYGGERSKTADREALARAKQLKEQGADHMDFSRMTL